MARNYSIDGRDTNTASTTILGLTSATTVRPKIYSILIGSYGTPNDYAVEYALQRYTAAGTSTAVTPQALDPGDTMAAAASAGEAHSAEPTYTANAILLTIPKNMRATVLWQCKDGKELVLPATAANGVGLVVVNVSTAYTEACTIHYAE
jgi:hypothetical protein